MRERKTFEKLQVWHVTHDLVLNIYKATNHFPRHELYGITSQLRRASMSVPTNIVEGRARNTTKDFKRFLYHSRGSLEEVEYLLILAKDLGYLEQALYQELESLCGRANAMLNGLIKSL